jgi:hypothetical protein
MLEPKGFNRTFKQALRSMQHLQSERNLYQISLFQWIGGRFTLADCTTGEDGARHELWLCINDGAAGDVAIEIARDVHGACGMTSHWCDRIITEASRAKTDTAAVRWATIITQYRDRFEKENASQ